MMDLPSHWKDMKFEQIPPALQPGLFRYIEHGIEPGDFLRAVLQNNLRDSIGYADPFHLTFLPLIVSWLYNHAPGECWGSMDKFDKWVEAKRSSLTD